jgi:ketosteroid isomerase-like protein
VIKGREAIHAAFSTMFSGLFKPGAYDFTMDAVHVEGDVTCIVWRASCATAEGALGADTFVVRNSKIVAQTFAAKIDPK